MKKVLNILLFLCLLFSLTACGATTVYEDTNGPDDFSLQTITVDNIINRDIGASGLSYKESNFMGITSTEYSAKNFNGTDMLYNTVFLGKSDIEIYVGYLNIHSGNFAMVVVNNGEIICEIPDGTFGEYFRFEDLKGDFSIHVAGESANFEMNYHVV